MNSIRTIRCLVTEAEMAWARKHPLEPTSPAWDRILAALDELEGKRKSSTCRAPCQNSQWGQRDRLR